LISSTLRFSVATSARASSWLVRAWLSRGTTSSSILATAASIRPISSAPSKRIDALWRSHRPNWESGWPTAGRSGGAADVCQ